MGIRENLIQDSTLRLTADGYVDEMVFLVTDLTPGLGIRAAAIAATGVTLGMPHPDPGIVAFACGFKTRPFPGSKTQLYVTVTFAPPEIGGFGGYAITITGSTGKRTVNVDMNGKPFAVTYGGDVFHLPASNYNAIPVFTPGTIIQVDWLSISSAFSDSINLRNKLNDDTWQGLPKWSWICRKADSQSKAGATLWANSYAFEYLPATDPYFTAWQELVFYKDKVMGVPPDAIPAAAPAGKAGAFVDALSNGGASPGGWGVYTPPDADFSSLNLPDLSSM